MASTVSSLCGLRLPRASQRVLPSPFSLPAHTHCQAGTRTLSDKRQTATAPPPAHYDYRSTITCLPVYYLTTNGLRQHRPATSVFSFPASRQSIPPVATNADIFLLAPLFSFPAAILSDYSSFLLFRLCFSFAPKPALAIQPRRRPADRNPLSVASQPAPTPSALSTLCALAS